MYRVDRRQNKSTLPFKKKKKKKKEVFGELTSPTTLFSDNQAAIALTCNHQYHPWTKHIDMHYYWIC